MDVEKYEESVQEYWALCELRSKLYHKQIISENVNRSRTGLAVTVVTYN